MSKIMIALFRHPSLKRIWEQITISLEKKVRPSPIGLIKVVTRELQEQMHSVAHLILELMIIKQEITMSKDHHNQKWWEKLDTPKIGNWLEATQLDFIQKKTAPLKRGFWTVRNKLEQPHASKVVASQEASKLRILENMEYHLQSYREVQSNLSSQDKMLRRNIGHLKLRWIGFNPRTRNLRCNEFKVPGHNKYK